MKNPESRQASSGFEQISFLPEPEFNPTFPNPETLPGRALARMLKGERLTQPSFGLRYWRLSAYIKELDYLGWPIEAQDVPCPNGYGTGRPIREYWLSNGTIHKVKKYSQKEGTGLNRHVLYERRKKQLDDQNPDATPRQRDAAVNQIAKECGV